MTIDLPSLGLGFFVGWLIAWWASPLFLVGICGYEIRLPECDHDH